MSVHPTTQRAMEHFHAGRVDEAEALLGPYLRRTKGDAVAQTLMAEIAFNRGRVAQAEFLAQQALAQVRKDKVPFASPLIILGRVRWAQGKPKDGMPLVREATEMDPRAPQAWSARGHLAASSQLYDEAIECYERSLALDFAGNEAAIQGLGQTLGNLGRWDQAVDLLRRGKAAMPANPRMAAELAVAMNYVAGLSPMEVREAHADIGRRLGAFPGPRVPPPPLAREPEKRLRVGLVSGDLRRHPVGFFMEPLLAHRDPEQVEYVGIGTRDLRETDEWSERLRSHCTGGWATLLGCDEARGARLLLDLRCDVLIDLAGHTMASGVWMLRSRLAPVQMTYLGYPNTTGISNIDYRIVSSATDPPGAEALCTERLLRMDPCMHVYAPPAEAPPVREASARRPGAIRLGSFNVVGKISSVTLDLWGQIMQALPGSTLMLKSNSIADQASWGRITSALGERGVGAERVESLVRTPSLRAHLEAYHDLDLALDPTPYNGTTTTCEALWMGVPVVALRGDRHAARVSSALLGAAGLDELITETPEAYVRRAIDLARDDARRAEYRATLRERLRTSAVCDGPGAARRFEGLIRAAWREACSAANNSSSLML